MPLKHQTETALVAILGIAIAFSGMAIAVLSLLSSPWLLWMAIFFISLAYPLALYPHFRERRADYEFRLLHFVPALFLLLWMALTVFSSVVPSFSFVRSALTFAWAFPLVIVAFALLMWFCMHVLRQWLRRVLMLGVIVIPFSLLGFFGDHTDWNTQIASILDASEGIESSQIIVASTHSGIRMMSQGMSHTSGGMIGVRPPHLPHAGGGIEFFAVIVPAATSAAVHLRAMRRQRPSLRLG